MRLYYAGLTESSEEIQKFALENIPNLRVLVSYFSTTVEVAIKKGFQKIFLDCGAYSAWTKGIKINLEEYTDYCKDLSGKVDVVAALDVIGDGWASLRNWEYMKMRGIDAIPTFHFGDELEILDIYSKNADYIAIGGTVGIPRKHVAEFSSLVFSKYPSHKFHGFGIQSIQLLSGLPFYSADATTWQVGSRFGEVILNSGKRFKAGKKFQLQDPRIQSEIQNYLKIEIENGEVDSNLLSCRNILTLYQILVIEHNKKDFSEFYSHSLLF